MSHYHYWGISTPLRSIETSVSALSEARLACSDLLLRALRSSRLGGSSWLGACFGDPVFLDPVREIFRRINETCPEPGGFHALSERKPEMFDVGEVLERLKDVGVEKSSVARSRPTPSFMHHSSHSHKHGQLS